MQNTFSKEFGNDRIDERLEINDSFVFSLVDS
jgi:hypothetical protein